MVRTNPITGKPYSKKAQGLYLTGAKGKHSPWRVRAEREREQQRGKRQEPRSNTLTLCSDEANGRRVTAHADQLVFVTSTPGFRQGTNQDVDYGDNAAPYDDAMNHCLRGGPRPRRRLYR